MEDMRKQVTTPVLIAAGAGVVLGLLLGLVIGWGIWPVQWYDAGIDNLRVDLQEDYLTMAIQVFSMNGNVQEAQVRWMEMGEQGPVILNSIAAAPPPGVTTDMINQFAIAVGAPPPSGVPGATPIPGETEPATNQGIFNIVLAAMCLLTLVIGGLLAYLFIFRNRRPALATSKSTVAQTPSGAIEPVAYPEGQEQPIVQYLTTYSLGNDLYDDSFSIDSPNGEFLGECGVGISETIGVGDPKKVTAFEVWLFDKNDIQTVTKVLMSQHAYNDPSINQRLASKGEPVLAEPGKRILLETATLQLEARVVNMNYGQGALPPNSYFDQMTLELQVWPKA
jgi:hypothetical protein